jgi:hypothetical protein
MTVDVRRYGPELEPDWHSLLADSRNGLFLFDRAYMDYHADRFPDFSAIAYLEGRAAVAIPATMQAGSGEAFSHSGLTFGGFIIRRDLRGEGGLACIDSRLDAMRCWGAAELEVRLPPQFLAAYPSMEADYALWRRGFTLVRRDLSSALLLRGPMPFNKSKKQSVAKAKKAGLSVADGGSLADFHELLGTVLEERHGVAPVHSLDELELLSSRFPEKIFLRSVEHEGRMLAGIVVYSYPTAWHTQYMAVSDEGRALGALDLAIAALIDEATKSGADWLSFGTSTTDQGRHINEGLLWQKESFGARSITHDFMRGKL